MPMMSTINLKLNRPPSSGTITIDPLEGIALDTVFTISLDNWEDS